MGTKVDIFLPASEKESPDMTSFHEMLIRGTGRILVMDDDRLVRDTVGQILISLGYEAAFASDGEAAVERYRQAADAGKPFDGVIMDLTIPGGMGGKEAISRLLDVDPHVKAIVSSGYSNDPIMANFEDFGFVGVVSKPYRIEELSSALAKLMARSLQNK